MMTTPFSHQLQRAQQGDSAAISELYEQYRVSVFRYLYYRSSDPQVAEDLTSEVFLRMIQSLVDYRLTNSTFQAWLIQIAHNLVVDHYRKKSNQPHPILEENLVTREALSGVAYERKLNAITLRQALAQINEDQRDVIVLRFVAGMPISEVAQALRRSENAIKALQRRGLDALRKILTDWEVHYA
ncbi:MAG: sigma-70 family RNA polymerase sigma factor [Anaerolineaceae bacterium]|jgi:RNA polymerase sigma-70 factor (ECF subfamily)